jgi:transketolase
LWLQPTPFEGEAIIRWATEYKGPVYVRLARDASPNVFDEQYRLVPGKTISLKEGSDVLLISTGPQSVCRTVLKS